MTNAVERLKRVAEGDRFGLIRGTRVNDGDGTSTCPAPRRPEPQGGPCVGPSGSAVATRCQLSLSRSGSLLAEPADEREAFPSGPHGLGSFGHVLCLDLGSLGGHVRNIWGKIWNAFGICLGGVRGQFVILLGRLTLVQTCVNNYVNCI